MRMRIYIRFRSCVGIYFEAFRHFCLVVLLEAQSLFDHVHERLRQIYVKLNVPGTRKSFGEFSNLYFRHNWDVLCMISVELMMFSEVL